MVPKSRFPIKKLNDRGNIALLSALLLVSLLGFGAICTDMALLYAEKSNLQNAVDASALAGAQELPYDPEEAVSTAGSYGSANGILLTTAEVRTNNQELFVATEKTVPLHLARILGFDSQKVTASARAASLPAHTLVGAVPLSITMQDFVYGEEYTLKSAPPEGEHGWFGPLRLGSNGAINYEQDLAEGSSVPLKIGQIVEVEHGNMSGPTQRGLETRLASDQRIPRNTFDNYDNNAPQIIYLPVVEVFSGDGSSVHEVKILGFAAFFVENVTASGNESFITGRFLTTLVSDGREQSSLADLLRTEENVFAGDGRDFGLFTIKLLS